MIREIPGVPVKSGNSRFISVYCGQSFAGKLKKSFAKSVNKTIETPEGIVRVVIVLAGLCLMFTSRACAENEAESTYKAQCVKCHGEHGEGNGHAQMRIKPADLRSEAVQKKSDEELYNSIALGVGHKEYPHGFAERGLSRKQISELVAYIRTFAGNSSKKNM